jgi:hypothetical protein
LSQLATARRSFVGENCKSDMLSDGSCPAGTSTSLLVSPVVELADAAGALEPKSAMVELCGGAQVVVDERLLGVEALRELVVMPRWLRANFLECGGGTVQVAVDVGEGR